MDYLNDVYAVGIAIGYFAGAVGLWHVRRAYPGVQSFGWLLYAVFLLWTVFYLSEVLFGLSALAYLVWLSRTAHTAQLVIVGMSVALGWKILRGDDADE